MFKIDMIQLLATLVSIEAFNPGTNWYHEVSIAKAILLWRDEGAQPINGDFNEELIGRIGKALSRDRKESHHIHKTTCFSGCNEIQTELSLEGKPFLTHFAGDRCNHFSGTEASSCWEVCSKGGISGGNKSQKW